MATAFTQAQRESIREKLIQAARQRLTGPGLKGCTVDELTREAGISKGAFYHFYESKEHLFLHTLENIQNEIYGNAERVLLDGNTPLRERTMRALYEVCKAADRYHLVEFVRQELTALLSSVPEELLHRHYISDHERIRRLILKAGVALKVGLDEAASVIWLLVMSLVFKPDVGTGFPAALRILVEGVCDRVLA